MSAEGPLKHDPEKLHDFSDEIMRRNNALEKDSDSISGNLALDGLRLAKRSVSIAGHRTSLSLEDAFWDELREIARERGLSLAKLIETVDAERTGADLSSANLSSALRVFALRARRRVAPQDATDSEPT
jgi:predicted DNA-binding ribbon-helix-helix protein